MTNNCSICGTAIPPTITFKGVPVPFDDALCPDCLRLQAFATRFVQRLLPLVAHIGHDSCPTCYRLWPKEAK